MGNTSEISKLEKALNTTSRFFENKFKKSDFKNCFVFSESFAQSFYSIIKNYNKSQQKKFSDHFSNKLKILLKIKPNILSHQIFSTVEGDKNKYLYEIHNVSAPDPYRVAFAFSNDRKITALLYIFLENKISWDRVLNEKLPSKRYHEKELELVFYSRGR
jgi:hypothetical protein